MKLVVVLIYGIGDQFDSCDEDGLYSYVCELVVVLC